MSTVRIRLVSRAPGVYQATWDDSVIGAGDVLVADVCRANARWCRVADILLVPDEDPVEAVLQAVRSYVERLRPCREPDATA
ncbi:hypothetical protein GCM10010171_61070 [Actinokineospora fastidiosa]|uniref:Uncharacterized protein n=1 Tax=Actinokineospora fastidiosa TaxID=1816 RepID=A0A918GRV8_9PSEU|nr:hypothetical protein GCM10010171_61070 [Actinokineospora fastidiosa]